MCAYVCERENQREIQNVHKTPTAESTCSSRRGASQNTEQLTNLLSLQLYRTEQRSNACLLIFGCLSFLISSLTKFYLTDPLSVCII